MRTGENHGQRRHRSYQGRIDPKQIEPLQADMTHAGRQMKDLWVRRRMQVPAPCQETRVRRQHCQSNEESDVPVASHRFRPFRVHSVSYPLMLTGDGYGRARRGRQREP